MTPTSPTLDGQAPTRAQARIRRVLRLCGGIGAILLAVLWLSAGCKSTGAQPLMPTPVLFSELGVGPLDHIPEPQRWNPRRVYYATTRAREDDPERLAYGNREGTGLSVGMSLVRFGASDLSWSELSRYSRESARPTAIELSLNGMIEVGQLERDSEGGFRDVSGGGSWFLDDLNRSIAAARDRDLLIYVHGAKVNFYNANVFAAQLDHFMGRDMTSLAFAWPSHQNIVSYGLGGDVERAYRAAPLLAELLELLATKSIARRIHVVCWSAGGRLVATALEQVHGRLAEEGGDPRELSRIGTVYFAAADVPGEDFLAALPAINALARRVVVTVSTGDGALKMARRFMGGGTRIGERNEQLSDAQLDTVLAADRLEVVDVSRGREGRGFDIAGHRYWYDHPWANTDLILAVRSDLPASERALGETDLKLLWTLPADYPERLRRSLTKEDLQIRRKD